MELAVTPLCRGGQLGLAEQQQYRILRALRALLPLQPEEMVQRVLEGEGSVPSSLVLLHLFSGAPSDLPSPHQVHTCLLILLAVIQKKNVCSSSGR